MRIKLLLSLSLLLASVTLAVAAPGVKDLNNFKNIPVLHEGRLKPLDTYARNLLTQFSGKDHYEKLNATAWLAGLFFNPDATLNDRIFQINNPDIAVALGIEPQMHRRYTPAQLQKSYRKLAELQDAARLIPEKERSVVENEVIRVFDNINIYADLSRSFLFAIPQPEFIITSDVIRKELGISQAADQISFIDLALKSESLQQMIQGFSSKSSALYTAEERQVVMAVANMFRWSQNYKEMPFNVIPSIGSHKWLSPWDAVNLEIKDEQVRDLLVLWNRMAVGYRQGNAVEFNLANHQYLNMIHNDLSKEEIKGFDKFNLEIFYHSFSPFTLAIMFYMTTFILFMVSFASSMSVWYRMASLSLVFGFAIHCFGLGMRIIIMARPPVSSLYETFIFVGFIAVLLGLMIERFNKQWLGLVTAAITGMAMLFIANKYSAEGDMFKMLVAVLNSNFWLATHVTTITMGYGATCVGGVLGHIWLLQAALGKDKLILDKTYKTILGILGVALTLTFLGTNLGGIWADQSWGRFWGWDPKENGALMIVLWVAMLFHAKVARIIDAVGLAVGAVIGMMVVMWAWFGVNLLSVGLHSYGFTSGVATSLISYALCEVAFLGVTTWFIYKK